jgi:hypothetical protein
VSGRAGGLYIAAAILALVCAIGVQVLRDRLYSREASEVEQLLYVRSAAAMQRIALGFDALAADVYWIRAIQHYGGGRLGPGRSSRYELLYPLLDLTTTLDPYYRIAYRFGAIFLSERPPGGPGRPDLAIALLQKGMAAQPEKWEYPYDIGFVHYWRYRDYKGAAAWFDRASKQPNAPNWLIPLTAAMLNAGGDRASARLMWQQMLQSDQTWLRSNAQRRLAQLDALDLADQLEAVIRRYPPAPGQPYTWQDYARRGILRGIPLDPAGAPFDLDPATGDVTVSKQSELQPMPDDAGRTLQ